MRYVCVHCDHRWETEDQEPPKRCPSCMRATGIEAQKGAASAARKPSALRLVVPIALVLAAIGGFFAWQRRAPSDPASSGPRPLDEGEVTAALEQEQVTAGGLEKLLIADATVRDFAKSAVRGASSPFAQADAIQSSLRERASALAFIPWSLGEPRTTPIMTARETLNAVKKADARAQLYPLEVTALSVAALRSLGVTAMVAELIDVPGERAPLDPSGYFGYFVVAVYDAETPTGTPRLYDPYAGRTLTDAAKYAVLSDTTAIGAALSTRAIYEVAYKADPKLALDSSSHALHLAGTLPSVRTARGVIVLSGKMVEQGLQEFSAASQLRSDAPRLHNLASAKLMTGDVEHASKDLTSALDKAPDFAAAHATLGALEMMRGDTDAARGELDKAEKLAPDLSLVQWALADLMLRSGDREQGLDRARRAFAQRPSFDAKLRFGVLLRQAGQYDEMRKLAHQTLASVPSYRTAEVRELITAVLGPTALDDVEPDPTAEDLDDLGGPNLDLKLGSGGGLRLGDGTMPSPGSPLGKDKEPKVRLGGNEGGLKLRLGGP